MRFANAEEAKSELKGLAIGALISVLLLWAMLRLLPDRFGSDNTGGLEHREFCENYCEEAEAVLIEIENPGGAVVCHCAIPDME